VISVKAKSVVLLSSKVLRLQIDKGDQDPDPRSDDQIVSDLDLSNTSIIIAATLHCYDFHSFASHSNLSSCAAVVVSQTTT
jgi:hypothetical protein